MPVSDPLVSAIQPDTKYCVVLRRFDAVGHEAIRGEILDTEDWPQHRVDTLIERRYLAPLPSHISLPDMTRVDGVNRRIVDLVALDQEPPAKPKPERKPSTTKAKKSTAKKKSTSNPTD